MCDGDPLDLVATSRDGLLVLDPDLTVLFTYCAFGGVFAVAPKDTPREKEGWQ
jgi:hypothetical protein